MTHYMKLCPEPFEMVYSGEKTIELRLNDDKRKVISIGDTIIFTNTENENKQIAATVLKLHRFGSFKELYNSLLLLKCGYTCENLSMAKPEDMYSYYTKELEEKYGALGIELTVDYLIDDCTCSDNDYICDNLVKYNLSQVPATQEKHFENISKKIINNNGDIIAGCIAKMYCWHVLYVDILWVDINYRRHGYGTRLLNYIENLAKEKGCYLVHLDTFDFQAKKFYIKHGYEIFGVLNDCPKDHCRYFLQKRL